jgi:hypothetical protein
MITISRSEITAADYNPRKISQDARKKLKKAIKTHGLVQPIIWNRQTGNIVGGHQRIDILDEIHKGKEYSLNVAAIDVDEAEEVKLNVVLNNTSVQGEWDVDLLADICRVFPDIDFKTDLGFEQYDLDYIFSGTDYAQSEIFREEEPAKAIVADVEKIKQAKAEHRARAKAENEAGVSHLEENNDYMVTIVFNNNHEKHRFMEDIRKPKAEKFVKAAILHDINTGKVKLR